MRSRLVVILNDNDMSIAPPVGAMSAYLSRPARSHSFLNLRELAARMAKRFPRGMAATARRAEEYARGILTGGTLFEELGFYYVGPIDGHNLDHLLPVLRNVRDAEEDGPILVHVITQKGRGYAPAEAPADKLHAVSQLQRGDRRAGEAAAGAADLHQRVRRRADRGGRGGSRDRGDHRRRCRPAPGWTGSAKRFPDRTFDVGIAEQHAVTFAAGMASEGMKPFCAIYSTFLQRAYDQVVHDVAIQALPVRFAIDRAGLVGADGATHAGSFDLAYLWLPARHRGHGAVRRGGAGAHGGDAGCARRPSERRALPARRRRRARAAGAGQRAAARARAACCGRAGRWRSWRSVRAWPMRWSPRMSWRRGACQRTVADARFAKPLDTALIEQLARHHEVMVTIEDGSLGGFGSAVMQHLAWVRVAGFGTENPPDGVAGSLHRS